MPEIKLPAFEVLARALRFRVNLSRGFDGHAFEYAGFGVWVTGSECLRSGAVRNIDDDQAARGRFAVIRQRRAGEDNLLDIGIEVGEMGGTIFLPDGEAFGVINTGQ